MSDQLGTLSEKELKEVIEVSHIFSECDDLDELIRSALEQTEKFFKTSLNNFYYPCPQRRGLNLKRFSTRGIPTEYFEKFRKHYHKMDPFYRGPFYLPCPAIATNDQFRSDRSFLQGEYYNDFLKPQSIHHQMTIYLQNRNRFLGALSCFRPKNADRFNRSEKTWAQVMGRHLVQSIERNIILEESKSWGTVLDSLHGNVFKHILLILNHNFEAVYRNGPAAEQLAGGQAATGSNELLNLIHDKIMSRLGHDTGQSALKELGEQSKIELPLPRGPITLHTQRLNTPGGRTYLLIRTDGDTQPLEPGDLGRRFKLSKREVEVACQLVKGLKNTEIAEILYISPFTVENHLRSIFKKMKARNRAEVVHKILTTPEPQLS